MYLRIRFKRSLRKRLLLFSVRLQLRMSLKRGDDHQSVNQWMLTDPIRPLEASAAPWESALSHLHVISAPFESKVKTSRAFFTFSHSFAPPTLKNKNTKKKEEYNMEVGCGYLPITRASFVRGASVLTTRRCYREQRFLAVRAFLSATV